MGVGSPRVSVVVPVYNRVPFLREAIESVLAQSHRDLELLLIDDGSTEPGVAEVLARYREDPRVRLERNERNQGIARVHNLSLDLARGEYVAALDSDDVALPERLARQVAFLDAHPDFALVGSWTRVMNAAGEVGRRVRRYPSDPDAVRAWLLFRCFVNHPSSLARTAVLRAYRYREDLALSNDYELFVRLARDHRVASLPEVLTLGRRHGERATRDRERRQRENLAVIAPQLAELGVHYDALDLERHFVITRKSSWLVPDAEYLEWAARWLSKLSAANRRTAGFAEPAFGRVLARIWRELCWRALPRIGWRSLACYWQARLEAGTWRASPARPAARPPAI